jgi:hypothetical protein
VKFSGLQPTHDGYLGEIVAEGLGAVVVAVTKAELDGMLWQVQYPDPWDVEHRNYEKVTPELAQRRAVELVSAKVVQAIEALSHE